MGITIGSVCSIWFRYGLNVPSHADITVRPRNGVGANGANGANGRKRSGVNGLHFLRQSALYQVRGARTPTTPAGCTRAAPAAPHRDGRSADSASARQVALLYMASRLFLTLSLVYMPLYLDESLNQDAETLASVPFASFVASFIASLGVKYSNSFLSSKVGANQPTAVYSVSTAGGKISEQFFFFIRNASKQALFLLLHPALAKPCGQLGCIGKNLVSSTNVVNSHYKAFCSALCPACEKF